MKYKGFTITEPSLEMFKEFINETNLPISAEAIYNHYKERNWLTKKGTKAKSVEVLCNSWNSIPHNRIGTTQSKAKVKVKNIDWEQRRYEISKDCLCSLISDPNITIDAMKLPSISIGIADALIDALKNTID